MRAKIIVLSAAVAACILGGMKVYAHHAFAAEFDADAPVLLKGKVERVQWINPHAWVHVQVEEENGVNVVEKNGKPTPWMVEGGTPNTLLRAGLNKNSLKPGTEVIVRGYQSKDKACKPKCKANGRDVTLANGEKIFMGSSGTGAPKDGADPTEKK